MYDEWLWTEGADTITIEGERQCSRERGDQMKHFDWIAVPLLLVGAFMLLFDVGATGLWIAVITVGIALVVIGQRTPHLRH
jgi:hypothetical protein